eukprot:g29831.t1
MPWRDRSALKLLAIFWWSLCVRARGERASAMLVEVQRSMMQAVGDEPPHEKEHVKKPNCLQPCDEGCFCNPAKHYEGIYFCDCTGRSSVAEHIYRQEEAYADLSLCLMTWARRVAPRWLPAPMWRLSLLSLVAFVASETCTYNPDAFALCGKRCKRHPKGRARADCAVTCLMEEGHAVWSSDQLMSEVARGSWGLARAHDEDLRLPFPGDPEVRWAALWELRDVVPDSETDLRERQQTRLTLSGLTTRAREASVAG